VTARACVCSLLDFPPLRCTHAWLDIEPLLTLNPPRDSHSQLDVVCAFIFQVFLEHQPASLWSVVGATIIIGCVCLIGAKKCQRSNNPSGMMLQDDDVPGASSADTKNVVVEFAQLSQHTDHEQHGLAEASGPAGTSRFLVQSQLSTTPRAASDTRMLLIDDSSEDDSDLLSDEASGAS